MKYLKLLLTFSICASALLGDVIVFKSNYSESQVFRAFSDNIIHTCIGLLSAFLFFSYEPSISYYGWLYNVIFCALVSSMIDVDHVFVARSVLWKDLTHLKRRGIFHCTSFTLLTSVALLVCSYFTKKLNIYVLSWMLLIGFTTHQIRDANRRGLWMYPFGHTRPLSTILYVTVLGVLPNIFALIYKHTRPNVLKYSTIDYSSLP